MGKIRLKTIGDEGQEQEEKKKADIKRAEKKLREAKSSSAGQAREEAEEPATASKVTQTQGEQVNNEQSESEVSSQEPAAAAKPKKSKFSKKRTRSANYSAKAMEVDKTKIYPLAEALELLRKVKMAKFDETVELHINTTEAGINGMVKLPHGSGKEIKVAIATEELIEQIEKGLPATPAASAGGRGKIDFDILIAEPQMMPKLAKVAKILGPRGLMPNPKNGTISDNPEEAAKKFLGGQISFKTEAKNPLLHVSVGKTSFSDSQLTENIQTMIQAVKKGRIAKVVLKSTMSPAITLRF